uniref:PKD/Chitinase domain-containing protein n=1 Tax=Ascaris lumbricoides TaxID=6252 RepID=A0A9J2PBU3_ASCLU
MRLGSSTPVLKLTNLQANEKFGPYIFRLEVSDASGQTDSATISILVNKAVNRPPQPDAGSNQTIQLPIASAVLNGNVKDDGEIIRYQWTQISGPNEVMIVNGDKSKCTVSGFEEGVYQFRLNVTDDGGLTATDDTFVTVVRSYYNIHNGIVGVILKFPILDNFCLPMAHPRHITIEKCKNEPPVARAPNVTVYLPSNLAILNGSESFDDAGIVRYMWSAHDDVPACIAFLGLSSDQSIAMLGGLVPGIFHFDLTVTDHSNAQNSTTVALTVVAGEEQLNSIEMYLEPDFNDITYRLRNKLEGRIATTLAVQIPEAIKVDVRFSSFAQDPSSGRLRVVFHTEFANPIHQEGEGAKSAIVVSAARAVTILRNEVDMIRDFHIASINTLCYFFFHCMLDCSGHGKCSNYSKECHCDRYWMPNLFNYLLRGSKLDCSWSILYFGLFIVVTFVFVASCIVVRFRYRTEFAMTEWRPSKNRVLSRRRRRRRFRRNDEELHSNGQISGTSKLNEPSASYSLLMPSDSLSSENETELSTTNANRHAIVEQEGVELRGRPSVPFTE